MRAHIYIRFKAAANGTNGSSDPWLPLHFRNELLAEKPEPRIIRIVCARGGIHLALLCVAITSTAAMGFKDCMNSAAICFSLRVLDTSAPRSLLRILVRK